MRRRAARVGFAALALSVGLALTACTEQLEFTSFDLYRGESATLDATETVVSGLDLTWVIEARPPFSGDSRLDGQGSPRAVFYPSQPGYYRVVLLAGRGPSVAEVYEADIAVHISAPP